MKTEIDSTLDHTGAILETLGQLLAVTPDAKLLHLLAAVEAVGELQDKLFDLRTP